MSSTGLPPLTYLNIDSLSEGVGASQIVPYVERLARRGLDVTVHSFEHGPPAVAVEERLTAAGVTWRPHRFISGGSATGLVRVAQSAAWIRGAELVHARSDMAAAAVLVTRRRHWVWDVRSFFREQRVAMEMLRAGSVQDRVLGRVERASARRSSAIIVLAQAALDVMVERFGPAVGDKGHVISTCVDLERYRFVPPTPADRVRFLLSGTLNRVYAVPAMIAFVEHFRRLRPAELRVLSPAEGPWHNALAAAGASFGSARPDQMPALLPDHDVGLSLLNAGRWTVATTPTKLAEFLACGRPVVVSPGQGDMDTLVQRYQCGVVVDPASEPSLRSGTETLAALLDDPETPARCRALAEAHFDVDNAVTRLIEVYRSAVAGGS
jgi:glycosyltransferase involved in cell wall biosynthesis